jgi:creatinine amidohydrolase
MSGVRTLGIARRSMQHGAMLPSRFWTELTSSDLDDADMAEVIAVLPVAAIEQHGPHLPLGTDAFIMDGYLERAYARLPADLPVVFLPVQRCGCSVEHQDFAGTLSLSARTALSAWSELAEAVARAGCRKLVIVNSHGGNSGLVDILAHELRASHGLFVVMAAWQRFGYPDDLFSASERVHGIHGGEIETSLMLTFRPDLVRRDKLEAFVPTSLAMEREFTWLRAGRPTGYGWMAQDICVAGAAGDAAAATAEKGEACADYGATAFVELLQDVEAFDLAALVERGGRIV